MRKIVSWAKELEKYITEEYKGLGGGKGRRNLGGWCIYPHTDKFNALIIRTISGNPRGVSGTTMSVERVTVECYS